MEGKLEKWINEEMWDLMNDDITNYIFEQGEKCLSDLQKISDTITARSYVLLGVITAIYPFILKNSVGNRAEAYAFLAFAVVCISVCIYIIFAIISPFQVKGVGRIPKETLNMETLKNYNDRKETNFKKYEIEALQDSIEFMERLNNKRARKFRNMLYVLLGSFSLFIAFICFLSFYSNWF